MRNNPDTSKTATNPDPQLDPDPDAPVDRPHDTHEWVGVGLDRWLQCQTCGTRDHWPAARLACVKVPREKGRPTEAPSSIGKAVRLLYLDLDAFAVWWLARIATLGEVRPTLNEWRAEFVEWSKAPKPDREV